MKRYLSAEEAAKWEELVPKRLTMAGVLFFFEQELIEALRWYFAAADLVL